MRTFPYMLATMKNLIEGYIAEIIRVQAFERYTNVYVNALNDLF